MSNYKDNPEPIEIRSQLPQDARRVGLNEWTAPGLQFASSLQAGRRGHRTIAWIALVALVLVVLVPVVMMFEN